ncbi:MAG: glycosyltransferase [Patescibacteria group bacterium]|nr:glycosyltransferase [Patescibacteria group bacterium]
MDRNLKVDIIIPIGPNDAHFLDECLASIKPQRQHVAEIYVIADGSQIYQSNSYALIRTDKKNSHASRALGVTAGSSPYILFVDVDNKLEPNYIESCLNTALADPKIALVYSDLAVFGDGNYLQKMNRSISYSDLIVGNSCDTGSLLKREAIEQLDLMSGRPAGFEDWWIAKKLLAANWKVAWQPVPLNYRRHTNQRCKIESKAPWSTQCSLFDETVTIFGTISRRLIDHPDLWWRKVAWLLGQSWPRKQTRILLANTSAQRVASEWLAPLNDAFDSVSVYSHSVGEPGLESKERTAHTQRAVQTAVAAIYNRMLNEAQTDLVLTLEDDIIPKDIDLIYRLMDSLEPKTAMVGAPYRLRYEPRPYGIWKKPPITRLELLTTSDRGYSRVEGLGFGCTLLRKCYFKDFKFMSDLNPFYDVDICLRLREAGYILGINWDLECEHVQL